MGRKILQFGPCPPPPQAPATAPARTPVLADLGMLAVVLIWGINFSVTKLAFDTFPPLAVHGGPVRHRERAALARCSAGSEGPAGSRPAPCAPHRPGSGGQHLLPDRLHLRAGPDQRDQQRPDPRRRCRPSTAVAAGGAGPRARSRPRMWWRHRLGHARRGARRSLADGVEFSSGTLPGDLLSLAAVVCWAGYTVGLRGVPPEVSPLRVTIDHDRGRTARAAPRGAAGTDADGLGRGGNGRGPRWPTRRCFSLSWPTCCGTGA